MEEDRSSKTSFLSGNCSMACWRQFLMATMQIPIPSSLMPVISWSTIEGGIHVSLVSSTGRFLAVSRSDRIRARAHSRIRTLALFEVPHRFTSFSSYLHNVRKEKMMTSALNVARNLSFTAPKCFTPKRAPLPASFSTPLNISYSMPGLM